MAIPACIRLADDLLPRARAQTARQLAAAGWSQTDTARELGVSQAMVSRYCTKPDDEDPMILRLAASWTEDLTTPDPKTGDLTNNWCQTLGLLSQDDGTKEALEDVVSAEQALRAARALHIVPQVGLNIARIIHGPTTRRITTSTTPKPNGCRDPSTVLAYPARIVHDGQRILTPAPPTRGASNHLTKCLDALHAAGRHHNAIVNIRGDETTANHVRPDARFEGPGDRDQRFAEAVATLAPRTPETNGAEAHAATANAPTIIHDAGAVGIEPCIYIAASTAIQAMETALEIAQQVPP